MNKEILMVVETVSNEKNVSREVIVDAIEHAIAGAVKKKYRLEKKVDIDARVEIDLTSGNYKTFRRWRVVEEIEPEMEEQQLLPNSELVKANNLNLEDHYEEEIPSIEFGRILAQTAKNVIVQKVRDAERSRIVDLYTEKVGQLIFGIVKRLEKGNIYIDLGMPDKGTIDEAVILKENLISKEVIRPGDRLRGYLSHVQSETRGPQLYITRKVPEFLVELFKLEVPEVGQGLIEILGAARDPGLRAKISVKSNDPKLDAIGACVGMRGSRVQAVVNELQGEKIDIVTWSDNQATFLANALAPAEVSKIFLYEEKNKVEVVIPDDQLSLAIGRKGQNVKLASNLTSLEIDILTEDEESERRQQEFKEKSVLLAETLDVEDVIAQLLVTDGYTTVDSIAAETLENLEKIEGFDSTLAQEIIDRSKSFIKDKEESDKKLIEEKIKDEKLKNLKGMNNSILAKLANSNIFNVNDFADLATFELIDKEEGILKDLDLEEEIANSMIMEARSFWSEEQNKD